MLKLLLLALLVLLPEQSMAASRKLGASDQDHQSRASKGDREYSSNKKKKCANDSECDEGMVCRHGYCATNQCVVNNNCPDDQFCYEGTDPHTCQNLNCDITTSVTYFGGTSTVAQFGSNHTCHSCSEWMREGCPCEFCSDAGCSAAALGCGIDGDGFTYKIECADDEVMINGVCEQCSSRVSGCNTCHLNAGNVICTQCNDGSIPVDNLCSLSEFVECNSDEDCALDKTCVVGENSAENKCEIPPSVKNPDVACQINDAEYIYYHVCHSCATGCAECYANGSGEEICNRCADGYEFDSENATSCVVSDCANHGLHSTCDPQYIAVPDATYTSCYTCVDPIIGGQVSCDVGTPHYNSSTGKYCCE